MVSTSGDEVREGLSSVTRGTLFLLVAALAYVGISFVSRVIVVDGISQGEWNAFSLALTFSAVLSAIGTLGLPNAIARSLPFTSSDSDRRTMVRGTLAVGAASGIAGAVVLYVFARPIGVALSSSDLSAADLTLSLQFFAITIATSVVSTLIASIFQGYEDALPNALFLSTLNPALFIVFLLLTESFLPLGQQFVGALAAYVIADVAVLLLLLLYYQRRMPLRSGPITAGFDRRLLAFALPLLVVGALTSVSGSGDTLILGFIHRPEVGFYTATLSLARLLGIGLSSLGFIFLPVAARYLRNRDYSALKLTYATATKWTLVVALPLFLVFFFLPSRSLTFVYGPAYAMPILPLRIVVIGAFAASLLGPAAAAQIAYGRTQLVLLNTVAAAVSDVVLSFLLIPAHGAVGAAVAWSVSTFVYPLLSTVEMAFLEDLHPFKRHYLVPLLVTAAPLSVVLAFWPSQAPLWQLPAIAIGVALLFVFVVLVTRSVDRGDRLLLEAVERFLGRRLPVVRRLSRWLAGPALTSL